MIVINMGANDAHNKLEIPLKIFYAQLDSSCLTSTSSLPDGVQEK